MARRSPSAIGATRGARILAAASCCWSAGRGSWCASCRRPACRPSTSSSRPMAAGWRPSAESASMSGTGESARKWRRAPPVIGAGSVRSRRRPAVSSPPPATITRSASGTPPPASSAGDCSTVTGCGPSRSRPTAGSWPRPAWIIPSVCGTSRAARRSTSCPDTGCTAAAARSASRRTAGVSSPTATISTCESGTSGRGRR